jgi:hypothetical protein
LIGFVAAAFLVCIGKGMKSESFKNVLKIFYALSCGSLIGDAVIHIIGEAYSDPECDPYFVSLIFILSLLFFVILERSFACCGITHHHWVDGKH